MRVKWVVLIITSVLLVTSCKDKNDVAAGTEFPEEFLAVWESDYADDPEFVDEGIFVHFKSDTVTYYGRIGDEDDPPFCYLTAPLFELIEFEGDVFTVKSLGLEEESLGEITIRVDGNSMEWVFSRNDVDGWVKTDIEVSELTPDCGIEFKEERLNKMRSILQ